MLGAQREVAENSPAAGTTVSTARQNLLADRGRDHRLPREGIPTPTAVVGELLGEVQTLINGGAIRADRSHPISCAAVVTRRRGMTVRSWAIAKPRGP